LTPQMHRNLLISPPPSPDSARSMYRTLDRRGADIFDISRSSMSRTMTPRYAKHCARRDFSCTVQTAHAWPSCLVVSPTRRRTKTQRLPQLPYEGATRPLASRLLPLTWMRGRLPQHDMPQTRRLRMAWRREAPCSRSPGGRHRSCPPCARRRCGSRVG
jgi:hypothetical protein